MKYVLVGQGENDQAIRAQVAELGLTDRFLFAGFQRDVRPYIDACDIMVMPSLFESAPLVLLECLAMEKAMVVSDLACFREDAGSEACRFVPMRDSEALALAIADFLGDPGTRLARPRRRGHRPEPLRRAPTCRADHRDLLIRVLARRGLLSL